MLIDCCLFFVVCNDVDLTFVVMRERTRRETRVFHSGISAQALSSRSYRHSSPALLARPLRSGCRGSRFAVGVAPRSLCGTSCRAWYAYVARPRGPQKTFVNQRSHTDHCSHNTCEHHFQELFTCVEHHSQATQELFSVHKSHHDQHLYLRQLFTYASTVGYTRNLLVLRIRYYL